MGSWKRLDLRSMKRPAFQVRRRMTELSLLRAKYKVIYADPPWQYSNSGFHESAEKYYPTMSIEQICSLPINNLAREDAILFLWVTSPLMPEGFKVCQAWGFKYKTSFIWIKNTAPSMGWYVRTKHEVLFLATKRTCDHPKNKFDSVFFSKRSKYSQKPFCVYEMIERMYPGPYLELFAREKRRGWDAWGNEVPANEEPLQLYWRF